MSRQFEDAARGWESPGVPALTSGFESMAVDLADTEDEFIVTVDVPGYSKDEIDVRISDNALRIDAEHEEGSEETSEDYLRKERRETSLHRMIRLPETVDED
ncbi:MAG: Hsp20/alpha crystallin family protein, partial [Halobacteriales archaeon]|nr:Hsp20/alpha crystallin family protein [Halobacteriales archaeon]